LKENSSILRLPILPATQPFNSVSGEGYPPGPIKGQGFPQSAFHHSVLCCPPLRTCKAKNVQGGKVQTGECQVWCGLPKTDPGKASVPGSVGMIGYIRIREWRVTMDSKPYVNTVAKQLKTYDSKFAKYQLANGDAALKKEKDETVPTLPIVETHVEPPAIKHAASTSAATGKRDNESALTDGDNENAKKKAKPTIKRMITLPQSSNK
jgi:hypothetical protein